jgi:hypothetical protein
MSKRDIIGAVAVIGALAFGACERNPSGPAGERGGATSSPTPRSPSGEPTSRDTTRAPGATASGAASSNDQSGTGGSGDAGMGRDAGMR